MAAVPAQAGTRSVSVPRWARRRQSCRSVANGDAGNVVVLQGPAHRFGLITIEAGEAGPEQLFFALGDDRFGERISLVEQAVGLTARLQCAGALRFRSPARRPE